MLKRLRKWGKAGVEPILWFVALLCLGCSAFVTAGSMDAQKRSVDRFPDQDGATVAALSQTAGGASQIEGRVVIATLGLSVPILSDCSDRSLRLGSCHVPGTAVAGGLGNMGLAGHRDGSFRPLRNIKVGDEVVVLEAEGKYRYIVERMGIVSADDVSVLAIGDEPELTLITCFPFNYVGAAPNRFVVHARLLSVDGGR